jgi:hypothetical protein
LPLGQVGQRVDQPDRFQQCWFGAIRA